MLNRRGFFLSSLVGAAGLNLPEPAHVESNENKKERPIGLAAPTSPQGASGAWPVNSPYDSV
jgi:hypothetical protein